MADLLREAHDPLPTPAGARRDEAADQAEFSAVLDAWASAIVANDPARIADFMEPHRAFTTPEPGAVRGDRFFAVVASGGLTQSVMTFDVVDGWQHADLAVVPAHGKNRGLCQGEPYEADEWVTDVFVCRAGRWRCVRSALTPNHRSPVNCRGR